MKTPITTTVLNFCSEVIIIDMHCTSLCGKCGEIRNINILSNFQELNYAFAMIKIEFELFTLIFCLQGLRFVPMVGLRLYVK
jgi:hypothetical protein